MMNYDHEKKTIMTYFRVLSHPCRGTEKREKIKISGQQAKYIARLLSTPPRGYISCLLRKYSRLQWPTGLRLGTITEKSPVQSMLLQSIRLDLTRFGQCITSCLRYVESCITWSLGSQIRAPFGAWIYVRGYLRSNIICAGHGSRAV
jgi:hypothetical protein